MSQVVEYMNYAEERGKHVERVVEIYESVDAVKSHILKTETEDVGMKIQHAGTHTCSEIPDIIGRQECTEEPKDTKSTHIQTENLGQDKKVSRCYTLTAVCVLLLCVLLLTAVTVPWIKFNILNTEKDQLQTRYNNLTVEKNHLQTSYNNLTVERDWLQTEADILQKKLALIDKYTKHGWRYFNFTLYYISTEWKNWENSRNDCKALLPGADLVIINSNKEHEFILKLLTSSYHAWIGLSDKNKEKAWKWVDGTPLTDPYWYKGQPSIAKDNDNCVETVGWLEGWRGKPCYTTVLWGICEMNVF